MALRDLGCNTTLKDESLALSLRLQGKYVDLEIQGVNVRKVFTSQHIKKCRVARVGREELQYSLRDVITIPSLNGPDQKLKWWITKQEYQHLKNLDLRDTDTGSVQLITGNNYWPSQIPIVLSQHYIGDFSLRKFLYSVKSNCLRKTVAVLFGSREIIRGNPKRAKTFNIAVGWLHCNIFNNAACFQQYF